jgi:hypothetical protein
MTRFEKSKSQPIGVEGGMGTARSGSAVEPGGCEIPIFVSNPVTKSFWMMPVSSSNCDHQFDRQFVISLS